MGHFAFHMGSCQSSPVGGGGKGEAHQVQCANGLIQTGSRVQTQYTRAEGGDDQWYSGTIVKVFANNHAKIKYDDGDKWEGPTQHIYLLNASGSCGPPVVAAYQNPVVVTGQPMGATPVVMGQIIG